MLSRRQLLAASAATPPFLLALSACKGPAPLGGPPPISPQVHSVEHAITAEANLIWIYKRAIATYSGLTPTLGPLLAEHEAHLAQLKKRIIEPAGKSVRDTVTARPALARSATAAAAQLRDLEHAATRTLLSRLYTAPPSLAQLYASMAASEATHAGVLGALAGGH